MQQASLLKAALACIMTLGAVPLPRSGCAHERRYGTRFPRDESLVSADGKFVKEDHWAKCYGINAEYKNECGSPTPAFALIYTF